MQSVKCSDIVSISFGKEDQWVIVMKNGVVSWGWGLPSACISCIREHSGVKAVALSDDNDWIVVYGRNGWTGVGLADEMKGYLNDVNSCNKEIRDVKLGASPTHWYVAGEGDYQFVHTANSSIHDARNANS